MQIDASGVRRRSYSVGTLDLSWVLSAEPRPSDPSCTSRPQFTDLDLNLLVRHVIKSGGEGFGCNPAFRGCREGDNWHILLEQPAPDGNQGRDLVSVSKTVQAWQAQAVVVELWPCGFRQRTQQSFRTA